MSEIQKSDPETPSPVPVRRERSAATRRAARLNRAEREARIISLLNRGVSIAETAAREGLSLKRMRNLVREILSQRMPQPPAEFLALQISRLHEALLVSYTTMHTSVAGANFEAVDRVVRIVREPRPLSRICARWRAYSSAGESAARGAIANSTVARRADPERLGNGAASH
ncbi:MAG TPA: hypothetical protein VGL12_09320 [Roseiarcus sp.]